MFVIKVVHRLGEHSKAPGTDVRARASSKALTRHRQFVDTQAPSVWDIAGYWLSERAAGRPHGLTF